MAGKGLVFTISHLLYDVAMVEQFASVDEISQFLDEPVTEVTATMQVLHNIMVAVTEQEYLESLNRILARLGKQIRKTEKSANPSHNTPDLDTRYTLNPIVYSLIEKGRIMTPIYQALRIVVSELLGQWEKAAAQGKLSEFTGKLSSDHEEGLVVEMARRVALREGCELSDEEAQQMREFPRQTDKFRKILATKFLKTHEIGRKLGIMITPSEVISYISERLGKDELPT